MRPLVGTSAPPAGSYTKRGQALSVESDHREEWDGARRLELNTSKGDVPASPLGVQERKKTTSAVGVRKRRKQLHAHVHRHHMLKNKCKKEKSILGRVGFTNALNTLTVKVFYFFSFHEQTNGSMTRRNTYVCERTSTERYSAIPNGKDSR